VKIVVFGPERRVGALHDDRVVDLNAAYARYLRERENEPHPAEVAAAFVPADLMAFIEGGDRTLDNAQKALDYGRSTGAMGWGPFRTRLER